MAAGNNRKENTFKPKATPEAELLEEQPIITEETKKEEKPKDEYRNIYWGMDLASVHERYLTEQVFKKPVILYNYPNQDITQLVMTIKREKRNASSYNCRQSRQVL